MIGRRRLAMVAATISLAVAACTQYLDPRLFGRPRANLPEAPAEDLLQVRALGVHGFVVRRGPVAFLTPPLYSNPPLDAVIDGNIPLVRRDGEVDRFLEPDWLAGVVAILVGHSHFDHLMDVPHIQRTRLKDAVVYGSKTAAYLVESLQVPAERVMVLNDDAHDVVDYRPCQKKPKEGCIYRPGSAGEWVAPPGAEGRLRIRALCSRHSPQFARLPVSSQGCYDAPLGHEPRTSNDWRLGDTFAYLVDFLDPGGVVAFRVYYQDSPTSPTDGYVPEEILGQRRVDVAILCAGAFDQEEDNPRGIIENTKARYVLFGHWDNFFLPPTRKLQTLFSIKLDELTRRVEAVRPSIGVPAAEQRYWFGTPGTLYVFAREP
jgi:hypothetical protein